MQLHKPDLETAMHNTAFAEACPLVTRDTPVGFELEPIKKKAAIQLMG
jgi:hypothetical protein